LFLTTLQKPCSPVNCFPCLAGQHHQSILLAMHQGSIHRLTGFVAEDHSSLKSWVPRSCWL